MARTIAFLAASIARCESPTRTVAPSHVVRAALEHGAGRPGRPLTAALVGQRVAYRVGQRGGLRLTADEAQSAVEAMLSAGALYVSGGRFVYVERPDP